jgi:hypothetical protein
MGTWVRRPKETTVTDGYDDQDQTDLVPRSQIRQLEEKAKKAGELQTQLEEMQRRVAFSEALGTAVNDPKVRYFIKGYDGELTSEAIRAEALEAGLLTTTQPQPADTNDNPTPAEMAAHARMQAAADGAGGNKPIDLVEALGPRGSKKPDEIMAILRAAGPGAPFRLAEDVQ